MADKATKLATLVGIEIENLCPCGEKVEPYERQLVVWHPDRKKWNRMCAKCITNDAKFVEPRIDNPGIEVISRNPDVSPTPDRADLRLV